MKNLLLAAASLSVLLALVLLGIGWFVAMAPPTEWLPIGRAMLALLWIAGTASIALATYRAE